MSKPIPKSHILKIPPYEAGISQLPKKKKIIKLSSNESPYGAGNKVTKAYIAALAKLNRYPDSNCDKLKKAIAKKFSLDYKSIVCSNGSDELITLIAKSFAGAGDEILCTEHGFSYYRIAAIAAGANTKIAKEVNCSVNVDNILKQVTKRTKIIFLANPGNPTGTYLALGEIKKLCDQLPKKILLVLDGAYAEFVDKNDYDPGIRLVKKYSNVIMIRTFSKIYGLSGLRLGWAYCSTEISKILNRVRNPFNVNTAAQEAGIAALKDTKFIKKIAEKNIKIRNWVVSRLQARSLFIYPSVTNFILIRFPNDRKRNANATNKFLVRNGIILRKVDEYNLKNCLRLTIGRKIEMKTVVTKLERFLKN